MLYLKTQNKKMERIKLSFNLKRSIRYENYGHILGSDAQNI